MLDVTSETVLLVDDDAFLLRILAAALRAGGYEVETATGVREARERASRIRPAVAVVSLEIRDGQAEELVRALASESPETECVLLAQPASLDRLIRLYDLRTLYNHRWKPLDEIGDLARDVARAMERRALKRQNAYLLTELRDTRDELRNQAEFMAQIEKHAALGRLACSSAQAAVHALDLWRSCGSSAELEEARSVLAGLTSLESANADDWRELELGDVLAASLMMAGPLLEERGVQFEFGRRGPCPVFACRASILKAALYILLNAVDALEVGGRLRISCEPTPGERPGARMVFHDSGPGIDPNILPRVFEPFFTTGRYDRRTGLGLSVARSIIREHNGEISLETEAGKGTTVTVWLPATLRAVAPVTPSEEFLRAA